MRVVTARISAAMLFLLFATALFAQQTPTVTETAIPRLVRITSVFVPANGLPAAPVEIVTFAIYADERGGSPLWQETQNVTVNTDGRYTVLLGATQTDGLPQDLFTTGEARWLGRRFERTGEPEQARVLLASVPYALKAADADMLGGKPLAAFVLADGTAAGGGAPPIRTATPGNTVPTVSGAVSGTGTINQLTKWVDTAGTLVDSAIAEAGGNVGIGTMTPNGQLHIFGSVNTDIFAGMGPNLISGPAFNFGYGGNSLGRSVGFFNVRPDALAVAPNPSLRFFTANVERMIVANTGDVGIGTSMPYTGVNNVSLLLGDGTIGWREYAPYDAILVTAGAPSVPKPLLDQLAEGGRLLIPVGDREEQRLVVAERKGGRIEMREEAPVRFVPLVGHHGWSRSDEP